MSILRVRDGLKLTAAVLAGAIGGGGASIYVSRQLVDGTPRERGEAQARASGAPGAGGPLGAERPRNPDNSAILARIRTLEEQRQSADSQAPAENVESAAMAEMPTAAEARQILLDRQSALIEAHERDPVDPSWSRTTAKAFESDFAVLEEAAPFKLVRVDCRTTSCLAVVRWENYEAALSKGAVLAHHQYSTNCARHVVQPPPEGPPGPYESTVEFDCTNARAEAQ